MRQSSVVNACSMNGLDTMPLTRLPREAASSKPSASALACPMAIATCPRGMATLSMTVPVADLVVVHLGQSGLVYVGVIAQIVEHLRSVGLRIDRLQFVVPHVHLRFGPLRLGLDIHALREFLI